MVLLIRALSFFAQAMVEKNLDEVNSGSQDFIVALCPVVVEYYLPHAQRPMRQMMSA